MNSEYNQKESTESSHCYTPYTNQMESLRDSI